jgi:hypothetical protein
MIYTGKLDAERELCREAENLKSAADHLRLVIRIPALLVELEESIRKPAHFNKRAPLDSYGQISDLFLSSALSSLPPFCSSRSWLVRPVMPNHAQPKKAKTYIQSRSIITHNTTGGQSKPALLRVLARGLGREGVEVLVQGTYDATVLHQLNGVGNVAVGPGDHDAVNDIN